MKRTAKSAEQAQQLCLPLTLWLRTTNLLAFNLLASSTCGSHNTRCGLHCSRAWLCAGRGDSAK